MTTASRVIVIKNIYHQIEGESPTHTPVKAVLPSSSDEQVYDRRVALTEEWRSVERGWVEDAGLVVVHHSDGVKMDSGLSREEKDALLGRTVEVGRAWRGEVVPLCSVPRDMSVELCLPYPVDELRLRVSAGRAKIPVKLYPR